MQWWGWLIVGGLSVLCVVLLILSLRKTVKVGLTEEERSKLDKLLAGKSEKEEKIEKSKTALLEAILAEKDKKLKEIEEWFDRTKESIDETRQVEFKKYLSDHSAAIAELNKLLGISTE